MKSLSSQEKATILLYLADEFSPIGIIGGQPPPKGIMYTDIPADKHETVRFFLEKESQKLRRRAAKLQEM